MRKPTTAADPTVKPESDLERRIRRVFTHNDIFDSTCLELQQSNVWVTMRVNIGQNYLYRIRNIELYHQFESLRLRHERL
jgi:hypothetical protein